MIGIQLETTLARLSLHDHPSERNESVIYMQSETTLARLSLHDHPSERNV